MKRFKNPGWFAGAMLTCLALLIVLWGRFFLVAYFLPDHPLPGAIDASRYFKYTGGMTNGGRIAFLQQFGWDVEETAAEHERVRIPKRFDAVYTEYNAMQQRAGMDLRRYRGKRATRYTYMIRNHPSGGDGIRANLLVYGNKIIAADVCSVALDGFLHGVNERE